MDFGLAAKSMGFHVKCSGYRQVVSSKRVELREPKFATWVSGHHLALRAFTGFRMGCVGLRSSGYW